METMENQAPLELIQVVETSGLEKSKQNEIANTLGVFFNKASEWDATIKSIVITSPDEVGKMKMAKEGRLTLKNMRLEAEKAVKFKRDEVKFRMANDVLEDKLWLKAGQMVEATFKNLETKLEEKEKFAERWEAEQKSKLKLKRESDVEPYSSFVPFGIDLSNLSEEDFNKLLSGAKLQKEASEAAFKKSEAERIQKEEEAAAEQARIKAENERLKAEEQSKLAAIKEKERIEKERFPAREKQLFDLGLKKQGPDYASEFTSVYWEQVNNPSDEDWKKYVDFVKELKLKHEQRESEKIKAAKEKADAEAKLKQEQEEKKKLEDELKANKLKAEQQLKDIADAEAKAKKDAEDKKIAEEKARLAAEKKANAAPDKQKLLQFAKQIEEIQFPSVKSEEAQKVLDNAKELLQKVSKYITDKQDQI